MLRTRGEHPLLYTHRVRSIVIAMFNVFNGASPKYLSKLFTMKECQQYTMRNSMPVEQPAFNTIQYNMVITPSNTKALISGTL